MGMVRQIRRTLLGIAPEETTFARRGFAPTTPERQARLEHISSCFVHGYHLALDGLSPSDVAAGIEELEPSVRGFAYEGAAMAFTLLDAMQPLRGKRCQAFMSGPGAAYPYTELIGVGWAYARLPRPIDPVLVRAYPALRWLVFDGYGFHEGYFNYDRTVSQQVWPRRVRGYAQRAFDQGIGRSLWFSGGANIERIIATANSFASSRQPDVWSGVGLACAYAGGVTRAEIETLREAAGKHYPDLAQGVAFAAIARHRANIIPAHSELAADIICAQPIHTLAEQANRLGQNLPESNEIPAYEIWRSRVHMEFAAVREAVGA